MPRIRNLARNPSFERATAEVETTTGTQKLPDGVGTAGDSEAWQVPGGRRRSRALQIQWVRTFDYRLTGTTDPHLFDLVEGLPGTLRATREKGVYDILPGGQLTPTGAPNDYELDV